jgi:hypothetical protein
MTVERDALAKLATEHWRLLKLAERILSEAPPDRLASAVAQVRFSATRLPAICAEGGLRLIHYDFEPYEPNLPVTVANAEEAATFARAVIDRTIEPTITANGEIVAMGKVLLKERA